MFGWRLLFCVLLFYFDLRVCCFAGEFCLYCYCLLLLLCVGSLGGCLLISKASLVWGNGFGYLFVVGICLEFVFCGL